MEESIRERIYKEIRDQITFCRINPGERLVESALANEFNASRSPIREALRQLESEGLLKFKRNKGYTVSKLSVNQVDEIYNIRWLLESYATRMTAEKAGKREVQYLKGLNKKLRDDAMKKDLKGWLFHNTLFHTFFYEHCGNANLRAILETLHLRIHRYKFIIIRIPGYFKLYLDQHERILRACRNRDGEAAEKYMKLHMQTVKEVLMNHLNSFPDLMT